MCFLTTTFRNAPAHSAPVLFDRSLEIQAYSIIACVAGRIRERASGGGAAILPKPATEFASGEAASEIFACHILYDFCLPPTFITFDESIK